jgi:hypothetical protein
MKLFSFTLAAFSAVVLGAYPQTAKALPFKPTCEGMQAYANSLKWCLFSKERNSSSLKLVELENFFITSTVLFLSSAEQLNNN